MLSGVVFGDDCTTESNCTEANTTCINTCVCNNDTFRNTANNKCDSRRYHNRITKTEWVSEPSLNIHL